RQWCPDLPRSALSGARPGSPCVGRIRRWGAANRYARQIGTPPTVPRGILSRHRAPISTASPFLLPPPGRGRGPPPPGPLSGARARRRALGPPPGRGGGILGGAGPRQPRLGRAADAAQRKPLPAGRPRLRLFHLRHA